MNIHLPSFFGIGTKPMNGSVVRSLSGFSLAEVALALGILSGACVVIVGLLPVALKTNQQSTDQVRAASAASYIVAKLRADPSLASAPKDFFLPAMNQSWSSADAKGSGCISEDGIKVADPNHAAFLATYQIGTRDVAGVQIAGIRTGDIYLMLSWPAQAPVSARNHYEVFTSISW